MVKCGRHTIRVLGLIPQEAQQTATARIAPPRRGGASEISPPSPPPQRSLGSRLRGLRRSPAKTDSEEADEIQRRVRAILDEYSTKAPPAEQWPPGRRIRVRGVEFHYKVRTGDLRGRPTDRRGRQTGGQRRCMRPFFGRWQSCSTPLQS